MAGRSMTRVICPYIASLRDAQAGISTVTISFFMFHSFNILIGTFIRKNGKSRYRLTWIGLKIQQFLNIPNYGIRLRIMEDELSRRINFLCPVSRLQHKKSRLIRTGGPHHELIDYLLCFFSVIHPDWHIHCPGMSSAPYYLYPVIRFPPHLNSCPG